MHLHTTLSRSNERNLIDSKALPRCALAAVATFSLASIYFIRKTTRRLVENIGVVRKAMRSVRDVIPTFVPIQPVSDVGASSAVTHRVPSAQKLYGPPFANAARYAGLACTFATHCLRLPMGSAPLGMLLPCAMASSGNSIWKSAAVGLPSTSPPANQVLAAPALAAVLFSRSAVIKLTTFASSGSTNLLWTPEQMAEAKGRTSNGVCLQVHAFKGRRLSTHDPNALLSLTKADSLWNNGEEQFENHSRHQATLCEVRPERVVELAVDRRRPEFPVAILGNQVLNDGSRLGNDNAILSRDHGTLSERVDLLELLWCPFVGASLVMLDFVVDAELLEEPKYTLRARVVEVMLPHRRAIKMSSLSAQTPLHWPLNEFGAHLRQ